MNIKNIVVDGLCLKQPSYFTLNFPILLFYAVFLHCTSNMYTVVMQFTIFIYLFIKIMHFKMLNVEYSIIMPVNLLSWCMGEINIIYMIYFLISRVEIILYDKQVVHRKEFSDKTSIQNFKVRIRHCAGATFLFLWYYMRGK